MPSTFDPIATYTFSTAGYSHTFSNISQSYTHLYVLCNFISNGGAGVDYYMQINGDTGSNYYSVIQSATTSSRSSARRDNATKTQLFYLQLGSSGTGSVTSGQIWLPYYRDSVSKRNFQVRGGEANRETSSMSGFWNSNAAINSLTFQSHPDPGNNYFGAGTSITLFGLLEA